MMRKRKRSYETCSVTTFVLVGCCQQTTVGRAKFRTCKFYLDQDSQSVGLHYRKRLQEGTTLATSTLSSKNGIVFCSL